MFCSSVFFCERKNNCETRWGGFSLTERTEFTELFGAQFRAHRRPSAYREHRAFQLSLGVMYVREESSCDEKKSLQPTILTTLTNRR